MIRRLIILVIFFIFLQNIRAQETVYIPTGSNIFFGNRNAAGFFGYLRNDGNISMEKNAQINFLGKMWINETNGRVTDTGMLINSVNGGSINFIQPNPVYGNLGQQIFHPGYIDTSDTGPAFSSLTIDNNAGVIITSDLSILNTFQFKRGHLYLNKYNLVLGDSNNNGKIAGYDEARYIVTGTRPLGGYVKYRSVFTSQAATFPIGPTNKNYSPLRLINYGAKDEFYARTFDTVFTNAVNGFIEKDSTLQLTWALGKKQTGNSEVGVTLQNDMLVEEPAFRGNREKSFVSLYNSNGGWDKPYFISGIQTPGNITSSFSIATAIMNTRKLNFSNKPLYLTKKVTRGRKSFTIPNAFSPNNDNINDKWNIEGLKEYGNCVVEIYNRYGQMVWRSIGYQQPWDGMYKGSRMPVATYYYVIDLRNGEGPLSGSVTLLR